MSAGRRDRLELWIPMDSPVQGSDCRDMDLSNLLEPDCTCLGADSRGDLDGHAMVDLFLNRDRANFHPERVLEIR